MSKKMVLLALAAVSAAMFAMPGVAAATPNHIDVAEPFTVHSNVAGNLSTTSGNTVNCTTTSGTGAFSGTTGGTMSLVFHNCTSTVFGVKVNCTSTTPAGGTTGTIRTTENLRFDLITVDTKTVGHVAGENRNGILVTPPAGSTQFAHFACAGVNFTVEGNGVIGTLIPPSPGCGVAGTTWTADFNRNPNFVHGHQEDLHYTGVTYDLISSGSTAAMDAEATITFKNPRKLVCT